VLAPAAVAAPTQPTEPRESPTVIGNRESGLLVVRATSRQHEKVQEFLDQVLATVKRQVLIEATVAEVQLNNEYQRGIDWSIVRKGASGVSLFGNRAGTPAGVDTSAFIIDAAAPSLNFQATIRLLESFGDVRVLSSPKLSVLNNQTALLRVTRDIVYFTITPSSTPITVAGGSGNLTVQQAFHDDAERRRRGLHDERAAADQRLGRGAAQRPPDDPAGASHSRSIRTRRSRRPLRT
jgi:type II secretory pathway component GspD/PulD (secretin)